jgi:hypothetical protein
MIRVAERLSTVVMGRIIQEGHPFAASVGASATWRGRQSNPPQNIAMTTNSVRRISMTMPSARSTSAYVSGSSERKGGRGVSGSA